MSRLVALSLLAVGLTACSTPEGSPPPHVPPPVPPPAQAIGRHSKAFSVMSSNRIVARDERAAIAGAGDVAPLDTPDSPSVERTPPCQVWLKNVPDGIAVLFAPSGESLQSLRQRVHRIAAEQDSLGNRRDELTGLAIDPGLTIPVHAVERNTSDGAELVLTTPRTSEVVTLRALVEWHEADMLPNMTGAQTRPPACPTTRWMQKPA